MQVWSTVSRPLKIGAVVLFLLTAPASWGVCQPRNEVRSVVRPIRLGSERPGVHLEEVTWGNVQPDRTAIQVRDNRLGAHKAFLLASLTQLRGLVQIRSAKAALQFVRLRTDPQFCYDWFTTDGHAEQEVTIAPSKDVTKWSPSGCHARLSRSTYRQGGFTPPSVETVSGGYQITRWVCVFKGLAGLRVQQRQESVGTDGAYRRTVLKDKPIPSLPNTQWFIRGLQ